MPNDLHVEINVCNYNYLEIVLHRTGYQADKSRVIVHFFISIRKLGP